MGIRSQLRTARDVVRRPDYLKSPFTEAQLQQIVWSDILGAAYAPLRRTDAMSIPPVSKARNLICGTIAKLPLRAMTADGVVPPDDQPRWMFRTDGDLSPFMRMLWTLDDVLFYGESLWQVVRGSDNRILTADRVPYEWWKVSPEGAILVHERAVDADEVVYFPGPTDGLLNKDARTLRSAAGIASAVEKRAKTPIPVMEIHLNEGEIEPSEARSLVTDYNKARQDPEGATVFTPANVTLTAHGEKGDSGFMVEARNQVRLDAANITGVPVALLDGSTSTASLTYSTQEGRRNEFVDFSLDIWMEAIAGRLSMDDIVPSGQHVVFDQTDFLTTLPSPTGPTEQD